MIARSPIPRRRSTSPAIEVGAMFEVPHPFVKEEYSDFDDDKPIVSWRWRPGTRMVQSSTGHEYYEADAVGMQILTVVGVGEPHGFAKRVFYTRRWRDPDGTEFGNKGCRVTALSAFRRLTHGYRYSVEMPEGAEKCK